jgi:hypothetical protein
MYGEEMKKAFVSMVLFAMYTTASATDWQWEVYSEADNLTMYVDKSKIRGAETKKVWEKWEYKKKISMGIASVLTLNEIDCQEVRARTLEIESFSESDLKGKSIAKVSTPNQWDYLRPGSWRSATFEIACGKKP